VEIDEMTRKTLARFAPLLTAASLLAGPAAVQAYEPGDWVVRGRIINVAPDEESSLVSVDNVPVAGSGVTVDDDTTLELDFTYMLNKHWGMELILGTSRHDVDGDGTLAGLGGIIDAKTLPPTLTLQYHFMPDNNIRPYAGLGINYTHFYDEEVTGGLDAPGAKVEMDDSWGLAAQAGVDIAINRDWFVNFDVKYIKIDTTAKFRNTAVGGGLAEVDVDIDPWIIGIGIGTTF
jgi:outer membrane protein